MWPYQGTVLCSQVHLQRGSQVHMQHGSRCRRFWVQVLHSGAPDLALLLHTLDCTVGAVTRLQMHVALTSAGQGHSHCRSSCASVAASASGLAGQVAVRASAEACPCTALQASLWEQLAQDKDVAARPGARRAPPSRGQVGLTAADSFVHMCFPICVSGCRARRQTFGEGSCP